MNAREGLANPLTQDILPKLMRGELNQTLLIRITKTTGLLNLAPLALTWCVLGWLFWRAARRQGWAWYSGI